MMNGVGPGADWPSRGVPPICPLQVHTISSVLAPRMFATARAKVRACGRLLMSLIGLICRRCADIDLCYVLARP